MLSLIHLLFFSNDPSVIIPVSFLTLLVEAPIEVALFSYFFIDKSKASTLTDSRIKALEKPKNKATRRRK